MDGVDRFLLDGSGAAGRRPSVVCLPTAAGQEGEGSVGRWMKMGAEHFAALAADVRAVHITNRREADDPAFADLLGQADLIYFSGGDPWYLYRTLQGSRAWEQAEKAWQRGAVFAGCSAGAMILGQELPALRSGRSQSAAFGTLPARYILPHFDRWRISRSLTDPLLRSKLGANDFMLGIDEATALIGRIGGPWKVMGRSKVTVLTKKNVHSYPAGAIVPLPVESSPKELP